MRERCKRDYKMKLDMTGQLLGEWSPRWYHNLGDSKFLRRNVQVKKWDMVLENEMLDFINV